MNSETTLVGGGLTRAMSVTKESFDAALVPGFRKAVAAAYQNLRAAEKESFKQLLDESGNFLPGVAHIRSCPLCKNSWREGTELYYVHGMRVLRCNRCQFVYSREVIDPEWDEKRYVRTTVSKANLLVKTNSVYGQLEERKAEYIIERAMSFHGNSGRMLDIGCSSGKMLIAARKFGWEAIGIEANPDAALPLALEGFRVINGFFPQDSPVGDGNFDLIAMLDVLEHVEDPVSMLDETRAYLKRGGILAIQVPNFNSLAIRLEGGRSSNVCHGHWSYFTPKSLAHVALKAGFIELSSETIISEIDRIRFYSFAKICQMTKAVAGTAVSSMREITPDWLHRHRLGYKILAYHRKRD